MQSVNIVYLFIFFFCLLDELKVIKKITLAHFVCATSNVDHVQKDMFNTVHHK